MAQKVIHGVEAAVEKVIEAVVGKDEEKPADEKKEETPVVAA
jgi:hypothetical protein